MVFFSIFRYKSLFESAICVLFYKRISSIKRKSFTICTCVSSSVLQRIEIRNQHHYTKHETGKI